MEIVIKQTCPTCNGTLKHCELVQGDTKDGELVYSESDCHCTETSIPGFILVGMADISELSDIVNGIADNVNNVIDKCNDIFEKVNE
jgi:hypothetical protein